LTALCESYGGNAYVAVWENVETGVFEADSTPQIELGESLVTVVPEAIKIVSSLLWEPVLIPKGRSDVVIANGVFTCDY